MSTLPLWLASFLYVWQALEFAHGGKSGLALAFFAYAVANLGFVLAARQ